MENNRKSRKLIFGAIVVAVGVLGAGEVLRKSKRDGADRYKTQAVDRGDITMTVTATGTLSAVTTVQVGSQVSGIISRLYADFNSPVKKGQLLAELDPTPFEQQVEQQRANLTKTQVDQANAEISFHRQERLFAEQLAAQADLDTAKTAYEGAKAQVQQTKAALEQTLTNLRYTKITSPIDGVVVARQYDVGQTVAASFQAPTLFTIAQDLTKMQVQADVDQSDIGNVRVDEVATFTVDAYPQETFRGRISQVRLNATVNQNVITYPVIIEVPNPEEKLRPNMTANVTIEISTVRNVLRVPNAALRFRPEARSGETAGRGSGAGSSFEGKAAQMGEKTSGLAAMERSFPGGGSRRKAGQTIYLLEAGQKLRPASIRTGISDGHFTEVAEGEVRAGDPVVTGLATQRAEDASKNSPMGRRGF